MNRHTLITILLLGMPVLCGAAAVNDLDLLNKVNKETFSRLQQKKQDAEKSSVDSPIEYDKEIEVYLLLEKHKITSNNSDFLPKKHIENNHDDYFNITYNKFASNNDISWKEIKSSAIEINDYLNKIDVWASNFLNENTNNTELSSINFRNITLKQEKANLKSFIDNQNENSPFLSDLDQNTSKTALAITDHDILTIFLTPSLLVKALADNFSTIVAVFSLFMIFRLLFRFILEKTRKRQQRRKSRRKRSIDGFIN